MTPEGRARLLEWYAANKRDLPWRQSRDPYAILVSEAMLQQTRVQTVIPYYLRWMERFPSLRSLADAPEQDVLGHWQGLGYYRRARNLQAVARLVPEGLPCSEAELRALPGIGPYTAAAVASIAYGEPVPLVDGNVERVMARLTALDAAGPALTKAAWAWASSNLVRSTPGDWNQALMELGATICTPRQPSCGSCPLAGECLGLASGKPDRWPLPKAKREVVELSRWICVPVLEGRLGLRQIPAGQWWEGMWEFPTFDFDPGDSTGGGSSSSPLPPSLKGRGGKELGAFKAQVTHHRITYRVVLAESWPEDLTWFTPEELHTLPLPAPQRKALKFLDL